MPHARFDCLVHKFPAQPMPDKCKVACDKCYCWLCDDAWTNCKDWSAHCVCDGTPPWATERLKLKQKAQASKVSTVPAADVAARFAAAVAAADGSAASASADDQQQDQQETDQKDEENEELFSEYQPRHLVGGQPHPDPIVETTSLSFAELPKIKHTFSAPLKRIHEPTSAANPYGGSLSKAQLETVAYAAMRHELRLPNGNRAGFFLGDGVGLGKGRQLAGIVLDNWARGIKRHLWVSVSADLCVDAERDLRDIGATDVRIINITKTSYASRLEAQKVDGLKFTEGVLFATYSALLGASGKKKRTQMIVEWLGGNGAQGCILFDEAHKAKNLHPEADEKAEKAAADLAAGRPVARKGKSTKAKSTKMAKAVEEVQQLCPSARVVYCSATGAASIANLAYTSRLGLWGPQTSFPDFTKFEKAISAGGTGAMELVALDMKRRGMYISRQLSFASASYSQLIIDLTEPQQKMYDEAARFWSDMQGCFTTALEMLRVKERKRHPAGRVMSQFWGTHQRFFRALCMAIKVPRVSQVAKAALAEGKCVVIGLQSTGEARLSDAVKNGEDLEDYSGLGEVLRTLISKFPTGDYLGRYADEELSDAEDEDEDAALMEQARGRRKGKKRRGGGGGRLDDEDRSEDEDEGDDLDGFIAGSDEDEEEEDEDEEDEEYEFEGEGPKATKVKLPAEVMNLTMQMKRRVLDLAGVKSQNAMSEAHLNAMLKGVEQKHSESDGPSVHELAIKAGVLVVVDQPGSKKRGRAGGSSGAAGAGARAGSSRGADEAPSGRRRLSRNAATVARSKFTEIDGSDDEDDDEEEDEDEVMADDDDDAFQAPSGLLHKTLDVRENAKGAWRTGKVIAVKKNSMHQLEFGDGASEWLDLSKGDRWKLHASYTAPGAAGAAAKGRRRRVVQDEDGSDLMDDEDEDEGENEPLQRSSAKGKAKAKAAPSRRPPPRRRVVANDSEVSASASASDSESEDAYVDEDDSEDYARPKGKRADAKSKRAVKAAPALKKAPAAAAAGKKVAPKRRKAAGSDDEDDSLDDSMEALDDDEDDAAPPSAYQHENPHEIRQLVKLKRELYKRLDKLTCPDNPLDSLLHALGGPEHVTERTTRSTPLMATDSC